jgi:hypothetical protein
LRGTVVQIVPWLPPPPEGVGGFAIVLANLLRDRCALESQFLVGSSSWSPGLGTAGLAASAITAAKPEAIQYALDEAAEKTGRAVALLHYAGYGYHSRGCPAWLVKGLERWAALGSERRLVTIFHEVYATGPPWRSSFWLSPLQRRLAGNLAMRSAGMITSLELYRRNLIRQAPHGRVEVLPVFSTVGEPAAAPRLRDRARRLVVFGGAGTRRRAYTRLVRQLETTCRTLDIEEIWDIGPEIPDIPHRLAGRPITQFGVLPASEVGALLLDSLAGFLAYPGSFLAKSTIFAAYCAHGMLPVSDWYRPRRQLEPPPPFWQPEGKKADLAEAIQELADRARTWYAGHALDRHAEVYSDLLLA